MIKGFNKFFESKSIHFEESKEFYSVRDRHRLSDSTIKDYFTDLIDDGFDISISVDMRDQSKIEDTMINENGIRLSYSVNLLKRIENPNKLGRSNTNLKKYSDFLELQSNYDGTSTTEGASNPMITFPSTFAGVASSSSRTITIQPASGVNSKSITSLSRIGSTEPST